MAHKPTATPLTTTTENCLLDAIYNAVPDARTGAAFVSVDTRVLASLVGISRTARETIRMSDPGDELFVDSGADCLQFLLENMVGYQA